MKTKLFKKIITIILTIAMLLGLNVTGVLAAPDASGRDPKEPVSLIIYKYEYDETLFAGMGNNGLPQTIPNTANAIEGVIFRIEKVRLKDDAAEPTNDPDDYETDGTFKKTGTTDQDGMIVFSSAEGTPEAQTLPGQGIYKVSEVKSATAGTSAIADFIVSLPMSNPEIGSSDTWLYDVYAYPKNEVEKTIKKEVGEISTPSNIIPWKYSVIIPGDLESPPTGEERLTITDRLDYRLSYVDDSMKVTVGETELRFEDDYELTIKDGKDSKGKTIQILEISITKNGFAKLTAGEDKVPMMYFSFDTKTNIGSEITDLGEIFNGGELDYKNSAGHEYDKEIIDELDKPGIDVYGIRIHKINVNNEVLAGAEFHIYTSQEEAVFGDPEKALKRPNGDVWEVTTDQSGNAYFFGLAEGTYYLVETKAPDGYSGLLEPAKVVINADKESGTVDEEGTVEIKVTNKKKFNLPSTGGIGTILFTAAGLTLIGAAVILLVFVKRKKTKNIMGA